VVLRRIVLGGAFGLVLALAVALARGVVVAPASAQSALPSEYLALGDSLATGVGSLRCLFGCAARPGGGYVADFSAALKARTGRDIVVKDLAINGETTTSLIGDYFTNPTSRSQLARAVAEIAQNGPAIGWITLDIGGNDALARRGPRYSMAEKQAAVDTVRRNLQAIVATLEAVLQRSGSAATLILIGYYDPYGVSDPDLWALGEINQTIRDVAAMYGLPVARTYAAFVGHESSFTWIDCRCPLSIHPTDAGYAAITAALVAALDGSEPAGTVTGTVRDAAGRAVANATVWFGDGATMTAPDGSFTLADVPAGVALPMGAFQSDGAARAEATLLVDAGGSTEIDLALLADSGASVQTIAGVRSVGGIVAALIHGAIRDIEQRLAAIGRTGVRS
jgi:lysophospholipase L1-like esterase